MSSVVRKISIGSDYKSDAMHYSIGQQVYGGHEISNILLDEKDSSYNIYIKKVTKCYLGKSLIAIWLFQLSTIYSIK